MKKVLLIASIAWLAAVGTPVLAPIAGVGVAQARQLPDFADLAEKAGPAVVNIRTTERVKEGAAPPQRPQMPEGMEEGDPFFEFFRRFFPPNQRPQPRGRGPGDEVPRGVGSGFVISADGYLLTNHHVVEGADEIYVTFTDKRELKGRLVGSDRRTDVALVKVEATGLPHLPIGNPTRLRVGEWVMAIGSPFGLDNTVTAGIVSAKGRDTGDYLPFIQTDVAVNPGNSGGPLLNLAGEVVGINSQIYSRTGGFMGISFAIPIDEAMRVADQLRDTGRVTRGRIGVGIAEVTKDVAEALSLQRASGALVRSVEAGSPAERGGVEVGDIITRFDGRPIERSSDLPRLVGGTRPGTQVSVQVWRKGSTRDLNLTVAELEPDRSARASGRGTPGENQERGAANVLGVTVSDISEDRKQQLRIRQGVLVEAADGAGARAGIRAGDVILALNNQDIGSAKQFNEIVAKLERSRTHVLLIRRGDSAQYVPVRPAAR
jgi:serine protease Do